MMHKHVRILLSLSTCMYFKIDFANTEFINACQNGAQARIEFHIIDDAGSPVSDATVNSFFDMLDRSKGKRIIGNTNTNGIFIAEAGTGGEIEVEVSKKQYYQSKTKICLINMGHEHNVLKGKWQPWGMLNTIKLLPIKKPTAIVTSIPTWKYTNVTNKWIGFDLVKHDFVSPYGQGKVSDIEVFYNWNGVWDEKYNGLSIQLRFPTKFSGGYYVNKILESAYVGVYTANSNATYQTNFLFSERAIRNKRGHIERWERNLFDNSKVLVVRSRCVLNDDGTLQSAHYFQLSHIQFACGENGVAIKLLTIYNPTPNDTNLEPANMP